MSMLQKQVTAVQPFFAEAGVVVGVGLVTGAGLVIGGFCAVGLFLIETKNAIRPTETKIAR